MTQAVAVAPAQCDAISKFNQHPMSGFNYIGKQGKQFLITDGIRTKYLTAKEFTAWARQHMGH